MSGRGKRRTTIGGQFAPRLIEMLESPAFRALNLSERRVLDRLEIEMASHGGTDNGKLPVTYEQFHDYGVDRQAIPPAIRGVVALGFVEVTKRGRGGNAEYREPNQFRLTYRHTERCDSTDDWRAIKTLEDAHAVATAARNPRHLRRQGKIAGVVSPHVSDGRSHPETDVSPGWRNHPTVPVGKTTLLSISGGGREGDAASGEEVSSPSIPFLSFDPSSKKLGASRLRTTAPGSPAGVLAEIQRRLRRMEAIPEIERAGILESLETIREQTDSSHAAWAAKLLTELKGQVAA